MLIILSGLPGSGKSTIATGLARRLAAVHVRIDTIEQAMRDCGHEVDVAGYTVGYAITKDNLRLGNSVVSDSVNPIPETRDVWRAIGDGIGVQTFEVEIVCSDGEEHRQRVEGRDVGIANLVTPDWQEVMQRDYRPWAREVIVVDTAARPVEDCVEELLSKLPQ